jgi:hypothetical protein
MPGEPIYVNGINGLTGEYLLPPLDPAEVAARAKEPPEDPEVAAGLRHVHDAMTQPSFGLPFDVHPENVAEAGWAVVFATDEAEDVEKALAPLVEHRRRQVGDEKIKVLDYRPGERWPEWLARHGPAPGNIDPSRGPYYVLLVGGPSRIPFSFQYLLDVEYAVGRLDFDDAAGYERYVGGLVEYEESAAAPHDAAATFLMCRRRWRVRSPSSVAAMARS